jgi:hypothetical protein
MTSQSVTFSQFCDAFTAMDRQDQFSYAGKKSLFAYLKSYSEESGAPLKLDVIALCCEYQESTLDEIIESYSTRIDAEDHVDDTDGYYAAVLTWLNDQTLVCDQPSNPDGDTNVVFAQF